MSWHVRNDRGYILVIVMGLLAALMIVALSLGTTARADLEQSRRFQDETAAEFLAKAGVEWALHAVNEWTQRQSWWQTPWYDQPERFQHRALGRGAFDITYTDIHGILRYGFQDEEARLNLATASHAMLAALPGIDPALAEAIVAQRQQQPWITPDELVTRGMVSPAAFYGTPTQPGLDAYVTVWGSGKINVNTAPAVVLATVPGLVPAIAEAIVHHRQGDDQQPGTSDDRYFQHVTDLQAVPEMTALVFQQSAGLLTVEPGAFRVIAAGRVRSASGKTRQHRRLAVIDRTSTPITVRYGYRLE